MRSKFTLVLFAIALLASSVAFAQAATTTTAAPAGGTASTTKIGVIDIQTAILATNEGQRDFGALQTKFQPKQNELQGLNKEVEDLKKQLEVQDGKLSEDARATMVKTIETKQKSLQRSFEDAQNDFEAQKNEVMGSLGKKVYATLDKYAKENSYSLIVDISNPQSPVLWASQATNITKAVVDAYNATSGVAAPAQPKATPTSTAPKTLPKPTTTSH